MLNQPPHPLNFLPGTQMNDFVWSRNMVKYKSSAVQWHLFRWEEKGEQSIQMELKMVHSELK